MAYPQTGFGNSAPLPPAPLQKVIAQGAQDYDVPTDLLTGIWHRESGSHYPNDYGNSSGYGGLFGTSNWNASDQAQADEAASVLAAGLRASGGVVSEALSYYNTGRLQGGYTSVPGETTFGTVPVPAFSTTPGTPGSSGAGPSSTSPNFIGPTQPTTSAGGGGGVFGSITGDISGSINEAFLRGIELFAAIVLIWVGLKGLAAALRSPGAAQLYSTGRAVGGAAAAPLMGGAA